MTNRASGTHPVPDARIVSTTMAHRIAVQCADSTVTTRLREWLDAGRLEPPRPLELAITVAEPPPLATADDRLAFRQPSVAIHVSGEPRGEIVRIVWDTAPALAVIGERPDSARVTLSPAAVARLEESKRTFLTTVLVFLLRRVGWHHVHAATAIDPGGRGWLFAGNSGAGKSTTAALLATRGWQIGTDDTAFLASGSGGSGGRVAVIGFREALALRPGGVALLDRLGQRGVALRARGKTGYRPEDLGGQWTPRVEPDVLCFTTIGDELTSVSPLGPGDTLAALVRWSAWVILEPALADQHLQLITALARQAKSYRVTLGRDLFEQHLALEELLP